MTYRSVMASAFSAVLLALTCPAAAQGEFLETILVELDPSDPQRTDVGDLDFMGGVEIRPGEDELGGISGLEWHEDRLYAVLDDGRWLILEPDEINGRLVDVIALDSGPLLDARGKELRGKDETDAEAITRTPDGSWYVAFEREHRVLAYTDLRSAATQPYAEVMYLLADADPNAGIETLAHGAFGTQETLNPLFPMNSPGMLGCIENAIASQSNCIIAGDGGALDIAVAAPPELAEHDGAPTDAACASDGTCYILFRSYKPGYGNRAAIVALAGDGSTKTIAVLLPPLTLDNFEGLAVREENGRRYLYIASDNNFSDRQRTLLMKFEIPAARNEAEVAPPPVTEPEAIYETVSVVIETEMGDITVALETERAPITAANFLRYVDEDRFDGTVFYRAMSLDREPRPNGLLQGGTQFDPKRILPGIEHEPTTKTGLSHTSGALSMAMGEPGTANGDFSIMLQDQIGLDARPESDDPVWQNGYAVFGYVTDGMDVVAAIHGSGIDPDKGEGWMKGQMLAQPVKIIDVRRLGQTTAEPARE